MLRVRLTPAGWLRTLFGGLPREVAILSSVSFTVALGYGIVAPAIPAFARHFGVSTATAASVISAFALMRIAGAVPGGRCVDRFGEHRTMVAGIAVVAVSSILAGFSQDFIQLILLRGVGGLGSAFFSVSGQTLLLRSVPGELRGRASGLYTGGFLLGGISGPAIGGLVAAAWSLRAPFFIYGVLLAIPATIAAAVLHDSARDPARTGASRPASGIARALRTAAYRAAAAANLADGFAVLGVRAAIVPLFVQDVLHRSVMWTGAGFGVVAVVNAAALLPGGRAADTLGRRPVVVAGCLLSGASMLILALIPGPTAFLAAMAVLGLGSGLLDVAPSAMVGDVLAGAGGAAGTPAGGTAGGREGGGTLVAAYQIAGDVGSVTGPLAVGLLVDRWSYGAAFVLTAAVLGMAAWLGLAAPETKPPSAPPDPHKLDQSPAEVKR